MIIVKDKDIFEHKSSFDAICCTTNGIVKNNGKLVMGAGVAKQFNEHFLGLAERFGDHIKYNGNTVCHIATLEGPDIFSFPTKDHWKGKSKIGLIKSSALQLKFLIDHYNLDLNYIAIPAPGCGLGGLDWKTEVKPILEEILDDRFYILFK